MGERKMADISVMDAERLCGWLPRRARETHKGDFGRILLLCGAVGYTGAPALAAMGAARSGAGLIFVGVPEPVYPIVAGRWCSRCPRRAACWQRRLFRKSKRGFPAAMPV